MRALLAALALVLATAAATPVRVTIVKPVPGVPVYGQVEVVAEVSGGAQIAAVDFVVDGVGAGTVTRPPYRTIVDVGPDNIPHRFEVVVRTADGAREVAALTTPSIQVDEEVSVTLHQVYVTATRDALPVQDLTPEEFSLRDDGVPQRLVTFARGDLPFTAVLLVDASASMRGAKLAAALRGATAFAAGMKPLDEAKLVVFSDTVRSASPFTSFVEVLTSGLQRVGATGGTAIADMLFLAAERLQDRPGRGAIVLLTDGVDTHSTLPLPLVAPEVRRSQALVYLIDTSQADAGGGGNGQPTSPWHDAVAYRENAELLARLIDDSGGRRLRPRSVDEVGAAFREVVDELRNHYVLGYYPTSRRGDGSRHKLEVKVRRSGIDLRSPGGYIDR